MSLCANAGRFLLIAVGLLSLSGCLALSFCGDHSTTDDTETEMRLNSLEARVQTLEQQSAPVMRPVN
jgi:hypothetical protein